MTLKEQRLLVVDDDKEVCDFLKDFFAHRRYEVRAALSDSETFQILADWLPDLILLDVRLTGALNRYDGIEILEQIKKTYPSIGVIMMTAVEERPVMEKALALGASNYIIKPFDLQYLERAVFGMIQDLLSSKHEPQK